MPSAFNLSVVTGGLALDVYGGQTSMVSGGLFSITQPQLGPLDSSPAIIARQNAIIQSEMQNQLGGGIIPGGISAALSVPIGHTQLTFDLNSILADPTGLTGQQVFNPSGLLTSEFINTTATYTGSDLRIIVDLVNADTTTQNVPQLKQLVECTTFTISVHREKAAVRAAGYINPKGFARGRRTIAGTLVLTQFTVDVLYNFLKSQQLLAHDVSKDTQYVKVDQLPPFNMTLLFTDEFGNVSYRRVLGVDFVTDGVVYSSQDMLAEQTISYMASDFTPLLDINSSALFRPDVASQIFSPERTVQTVLSSGQQFAIPPTNIFSQA